MAAPESSPRRPTRTPARPRAASSQNMDSEPPTKRRRYVPGGPGGGGRWVDEEGNETTGPSTSVRRHRSVLTGDDNDGDMSSPRTVRRPPPSTRPRRDRDRNRDRRPTATPDPVTVALLLQPLQVKPVTDTNHEKKGAGKNFIRTSMSIKVLLCSQPTM
ncbi:unnamed protein product [Aureobasidium mustum]|uniref:Uncharacterized protein n=1 Tax=Aureobasidium mustum TaxID=2773714 RepID=A0A9N8JP44_9PEZI|nr:unnamed protein product [Aureobasidium mustum]